MDMLEILVKARALIEKPENWLVGRLYNADRTAFCARGAILVAAQCRELDTTETAVCEVLNAEISTSFGAPPSRFPTINSVAWYNNTHSHAEVLRMFDGAIEKLRCERRAHIVQALMDNALKEKARCGSSTFGASENLSHSYGMNTPRSGQRGCSTEYS